MQQEGWGGLSCAADGGARSSTGTVPCTGAVRQPVGAGAGLGRCWAAAVLSRAPTPDGWRGTPSLWRPDLPGLVSLLTPAGIPSRGCSSVQAEQKVQKMAQDEFFFLYCLHVHKGCIVTKVQGFFSYIHECKLLAAVLALMRTAKKIWSQNNCGGCHSELFFSSSSLD